jgi:hypothetical protein
MKKYLLLVIYAVTLKSMQKKISPQKNRSPVDSCQIYLNQKRNAFGLVKPEWYQRHKGDFFFCLADNLVLSILNEINSNQQIVNPVKKKILDYIQEHYSPKTLGELKKSDDYELWKKILKSAIKEQFRNLMSQQERQLFFAFKEKLKNEFSQKFVENIIQSDRQIDLADTPFMFWKN